eukprot:Partr_v1_DN27581_c0_g1_i4_m30731 putative SWT1 RNA endoribonuclease homolog (S. cerevisiae)
MAQSAVIISQGIAQARLNPVYFNEQSLRQSQLFSLLHERTAGMPCRSVIVVDTSFLLNQLAFIQSLLTSLPSDFVMVVPCVALVELEELQKSQTPVAPGISISSVSVQARSLLTQHAASPSLVRQSLQETLSRATSLNEVIIDCCLYYHKHVTDAVILLSDLPLVAELALKMQLPCLSEFKASGGELVAMLEQKIGFSSLQHLFLHVVVNCLNLLMSQLPLTMYKYLTDAYGNDYLEIVAKRPPWSLVDMLFLLRKHWIAVFSDHFPRMTRGYLLSYEDAAKNIEAFLIKGGDKLFNFDTQLLMEPHGAYALGKSTRLEPRAMPDQAGYMALTAGEVNDIMMATLELVKGLALSDSDKRQVNAEMEKWMGMARKWMKS